MSTSGAGSAGLLGGSSAAACIGTIEADRKGRRRVAVRKWREANRRLDYSPAADTLRIIEQHLAAGLDRCTVGVIDRLVRAGHRAISGNR